MLVLGTIVVDEVVAPVTRIHMQGGAFIVTATLTGPVEGREEKLYDLRLHGIDSRVVMSGKLHSGWPTAEEGQTVEIAFAATPDENSFHETPYPFPPPEVLG